jgi:hypothetical protein
MHVTNGSLLGLSDCLTGGPANVAAWKASALQEPPPRCLVFLLPGDAPASEPVMPLPHLDDLAAQGSSGLLALRDMPWKADGQREDNKQFFAQLLGIHAHDAAQKSLADRCASVGAHCNSHCNSVSIHHTITTSFWQKVLAADTHSNRSLDAAVLRWDISDDRNRACKESLRTAM